MPLPPDTLRQHARGTTFIETGTYKGDGVRQALDAGFERVYSIELNDALFLEATDAFAGDSRVHVVHGDSALKLTSILADLGACDATIWLDAHASGPLKYAKGTPLLDELHAIASSRCTATILIDDCRLLGCAEWKYVTKDNVLRSLAALPYAHTVTYIDGHQKDDIMVVTPA